MNTYHYLYAADKKLVNKIAKCKSMKSYQFLIDINNFLHHKSSPSIITLKRQYLPHMVFDEIYNFNNTLCDDSNKYQKIWEKGKRLYSTNISNTSPEYNVIIINKEIMKSIIEFYRNKVVAYYSNLLNNESRELLDEHMKNMCNEWISNYPKPYNLCDNVLSIADSKINEYRIFDLVHIYKTFDWDNKYMLFSNP